jgi:hypothetical protein
MSKELEFKVEGEEGVTPDLTVTFEADFNQVDQQQLGDGISIDKIDIRNPYDEKVELTDLPGDTQDFIIEEADELARQAFGRAY